jgi:hypothetical protein
LDIHGKVSVGGRLWGYGVHLEVKKSFKMYAQSILNSILPVQDYILPEVGKMTINYVGDIVYI